MVCFLLLLFDIPFFAAFSNFAKSSSCLSLSFRPILNFSMSFSISPRINAICSSFVCCKDFDGWFWKFSVHFENVSILKFKILILFSSLVNSVSLLLSSIKYILNDNRSFSGNVLNGKQKCSVLFTSLRLLKLTFT